MSHLNPYSPQLLAVAWYGSTNCGWELAGDQMETCYFYNTISIKQSVAFHFFSFSSHLTWLFRISVDSAAHTFTHSFVPTANLEPHSIYCHVFGKREDTREPRGTHKDMRRVCKTHLRVIWEPWSCEIATLCPCKNIMALRITGVNLTGYLLIAGI